MDWKGLVIVRFSTLEHPCAAAAASGVVFDSVGVQSLVCSSEVERRGGVAASVELQSGLLSPPRVCSL